MVGALVKVCGEEKNEMDGKNGNEFVRKMDVTWERSNPMSFIKKRKKKVFGPQTSGIETKSLCVDRKTPTSSVNKRIKIYIKSYFHLQNLCLRLGLFKKNCIINFPV